jgi:hypothetical protein
MECGYSGSIRSRATRWLTLAAGPAYLAEAPIDAGECDAVRWHPQPWYMVGGPRGSAPA